MNDPAGDHAPRQRSSEPASPERERVDREKKLAAILRRVSEGDLSVVDQVYWLQMLGEDTALK